MTILTRRQFLLGSGIVLLAMQFPPVVRAQSVRIRYSAHSGKGVEMLRKYARAVAIMRDATPEAIPRSWKYQWYIHAVPNDAKARELRRIYGAAESPQKTLASAVWQTCEPHFSGAAEYFLPWHRMYVLAFENIVRAVLNDDTFTLPYWDYTVAGQRAIPEQFRRKDDPEYQALYIQNRKRTNSIEINAGDPMDKGATVSPFDLQTMDIAQYAGPGGFCQALEWRPHGIVHTGVGDVNNMGDVPTAAGDPIFWLHHCMIDRIWAGWNAHNGQNEYDAESFTFADPAGVPVAYNTADFGTTATLGYQYDDLPAPPSGPLTIIGVTAAARPMVRLATSLPTEITLGPSATRVPLKASVEDHGIVGEVSSLSAGGRLLVTLERVSTDIEPGALYEVFVDLPQGADLATRKDHYIGTFSFFGRSAEHGSHSSITFDATDALRKMANQTGANIDYEITIIPVHLPDAGATPKVGVIRMDRR